MKTLPALLGPLVTFAVGVVVTYIALQQWRLARAKLRLDLFDRRFKVFEATRKFLAIIVRLARFEDAELYEFYAGTADAEFLFGLEVSAYLKQVTTRALNMRTHQRHYEPLAVGPERTRRVEAEHEHLKWLYLQLTDITVVFMPYLGFSQIRG